ncbi:alpha/beta hydrolase [Bradyrhizobium sp. U87765 SZCCT0131]|uniref:alpha/beta fold hydrolase n=1 Tax=unclassified Bradyrhizobium TaxID=2631580 RepID=UPI001BAD73F1|nr:MULTISPECIES: alpha/beta hydrolase [unclassified Bradyrhizobium]MBR1219894.1 alpha/beta hydrolase [Bradyrhizobium sp. U87765 SZCCT0131]MBR1263650.1 alpha/beta hydrolase [Bradyrhizobium sp. U87765 SZCCT0134]MBR1309219.1 alpha/beta hydrolase [Bradyrhizobium sp. U87765 SZCCT0110]MBR1323982.1 alpha/beta hydrolase [Bradyrhizobium sp. U87765 SZCCT0109]MBR1349534.1 alpha/beta hydrolase [Bradyrhizobium sp. U87765 SZCCT0048]
MPVQSRDVFCVSADGLKLHARETMSANGPHPGLLPVLCLPGLTRTTADFDVLAQALAGDTQAPRRVVAIDYRGRGLSSYDANIANYAVPIEMGDVLAVAAHLGIDRAIIAGTSRGGLIAMTMAATASPLLAGAVLNDIGPVIEMTGLLRIKSYVGARPVPASWDDAARGTKAMFGRDFPNLGDDDWLAWARRAWRERDGRLEQTYDPALGETLAALTPETPLPPLWEAFDALQPHPLMLVHGALSDLLSRDTVRAMAARRPDLDLVEIADQGHAPLLADALSITRIGAFCGVCDRAASVAA